jgi:DHA1 family bicyclomycin/chloramphenicol resistance-like MFS transporter
MAVMGAGMFVSTVFGVPKTLAAAERSRSGIKWILPKMTELIRDPSFRWPLIAQCPMVGALFTYVAASAISLREEYGVGSQQFTVVFATNAAAMAATSLMFRLLIDRTPLLVQAIHRTRWAILSSVR